MAQSLPVATSVKFHLSLNVPDLKRSIEFYRIFFGTDPAKVRDDYAKFELEDPPLVLSLEPNAKSAGGTLNHLGFRVPDSATLVAMQQRLEQAGISSQREEGVECCYARQSKFWVHDPDQTLWEIYTFEEDLDHRGAGQAPETVRHSNELPSANVWEHRLGEPVPERAPYDDGSVDEVALRGSLNVPLTEADQQHLVAEAMRVLRPGGRVFVHVLTADRPLESAPDLPGPASHVKHVPLESAPVHLLESAGFTSARFLKLNAQPCFTQGDVKMRETQIEAFKPS